MMDFVVRACTWLALAILFVLVLLLVGTVVWFGTPAIGWTFLSAPPGSDLTSGGIFPAIIGTLLVTILMTIAGVPVGIITSIYLTEYAPKQSRQANWVRAAVRNLAGVPSIVFGLFGLGFFVLFVGGTMDTVIGAKTALFGQPCVLWASLTLSVLTLPVVIVTCEEALLRVPKDVREASAALGASKLQGIARVLLPQASAGILTGVVLAVSRGAGEVAPILFTGVANYLPVVPTDLRAGFMHLGYNIYVLATQSPDIVRSRATLFGTVLVLLVLTLSLNAVALVLRARLRGSP